MKLICFCNWHNFFSRSIVLDQYPCTLSTTQVKVLQLHKAIIMSTSNSVTRSLPVETGLQNAVDIWKSVQWSHQLASIASSVESHRQGREQSLTARKALAETTKQFKKSVRAAESAVMASSEEGSTIIRDTMEALSKECRVTIKAFQEEIDNLTRRCKNAENSYASLLAMLQELPDPATFLVEAQHELKVQQDILFETCQKVSTELEEANQKNEEYKKQIQQLQQEKGDDNTAYASSSALTNEEREELISLRKEVAEYEVEFRGLKNQDITIRKLEDKIYELQTAGAESLQKSIAQAREELAISEGRKVAAALEREATLLAKIESLQVQLRSERAGKQATATSLLEADEGLSRREAAWEAQRQILVDDNERLRESLRLVTRERDEQALKIQALSSHSNKEMAPPSGGFTKQDLVLERNAYEAEVSLKLSWNGKGSFQQSAAAFIISEEVVLMVLCIL
jgi:homeobox protein cut-like